MSTLLTHYKKVVVPALEKEFGYTNAHAVPRVEKVVLTVGLSAKNKDQKLPEAVEESLRRITGQRPVKTLAKKSLSNFKIRKGMTVGMQVTLRGQRMFDFLEKFIHLTLPRVRDFRGLAKTTVDARGNMSVGFREHVAFPEISPDEIERVHGLGVTIVTTAQTRKEGTALLQQLGFPFATS